MEKEPEKQDQDREPVNWIIQVIGKSAAQANRVHKVNMPPAPLKFKLCLENQAGDNAVIKSWFARAIAYIIFIKRNGRHPLSENRMEVILQIVVAIGFAIMACFLLILCSAGGGNLL